MDEKKIRVAITHGDTNGVGYEMILRAFEDSTMLELCTPIVYGSAKVAEYYINRLKMEEVQINQINDASEARPGRLNLLDCFGNEEIPVMQGEATRESGLAALKALQRAVDDYKKGAFDVLVTAPVNRSTMDGFNGHADFLEKQLNEGSKGLSVLLNDDFRVALVTNNLAIKDIPESITKQRIVEKGILFSQILRRDLRVSSPRIAVLSLNPRCGEEGALGDEEHEIIAPAIEQLAGEGIQAFGPYAADSFFGHADYYHFDGVLAMYHDQGTTPFKTLAPEDGVRFTAGLPIVRTAPAHGVMLNMAGRNQASGDSLRHAIYTAIDVARNRTHYDEPLQNPLPKLYHEKREDGEKVRFRSSEPKSPKQEAEATQQPKTDEQA
jgi:4-hydroxythreonine-4-phosphate dehydrogenase